MTEIVIIPEFDTDLKKIRKKYRSIDDDLKLFLTALKPTLPDTLPHTVRIPSLGEDFSGDPVYRVRAFRCQSLKGCGSRSGIRVIYGYHPEKDVVTLIQIYHKSKTENHDHSRIIGFLKNSF